MDTATRDQSVSTAPVQDGSTPGDRVRKLIEEVQAGVAQVQTSEDWKRWLDACAKFWKYSFFNQMLIAIQRPGATWVAGFQRWKELGRFVRKGEHGIRILAPLIMKVEDQKTGLKEARIVGFRSVCVFDAAQTDGDPLPEIYHPLKGEGPAGVFIRIKNNVIDGSVKSRIEELRRALLEIKIN